MCLYVGMRLNVCAFLYLLVCVVLCAQVSLPFRVKVNFVTFEFYVSDVGYSFRMCV
jgi:hypothetical protein